MQFQNFLAAASETSDMEISTVSASVVGDVYDVLAVVEPASPELSGLAGRAIESLDAALREAAGVPADVRWRIAYDALTAFVDAYARYSRSAGDLESFERLSNFLVENADLLRVSADEPEPLQRALALAHADRW